MSKARFMLRATVYLILVKNNGILLLRRFNTGWEDGNYSLISGHLDGQETVTQAMMREAKEEAGISIKTKDLHVAHAMHRKSEEDLEFIDFFLVADTWKGEPKITEPDKCDEMKWFPFDNLPRNLLHHVKQAIENFQHNIAFSEFGWN
jgi:ADP-ribose pyrophosphatase YjhB (NUDIX family)